MRHTTMTKTIKSLINFGILLVVCSLFLSSTPAFADWSDDVYNVKEDCYILDYKEPFVDDDGNVFIFYTYYEDSVIYFNCLTSDTDTLMDLEGIGLMGEGFGEGWSDTNISTHYAGGLTPFNFDVAMDDDGNFHVVCSETEGTSHIYYNKYSNGTFSGSATEIETAATYYTYWPSIAVNEDGEVAIATSFVDSSLATFIKLYKINNTAFKDYNNKYI